MSRRVSRDEFFARLYADRRDVMPTTEQAERTIWRVQATREVFGVSTPGWRNPGDESTYYLAP